MTRFPHALSAWADPLLTQGLGCEVAAPWREGIVKRQPS
jgi:hypothetical protein